MLGKSLFSLEERIEIVQLYYSRKLTIGEINRKYGKVSKNLLCAWKKKYHIDGSYPQKKLPLPTESILEEPMKDSVETKQSTPETEKLLSRIARLEKELKWEKMRTQALETLIDVAEENGLKVRKKSGAKQ